LKVVRKNKGHLSGKWIGTKHSRCEGSFKWLQSEPGQPNPSPIKRLPPATSAYPRGNGPGVRPRRCVLPRCALNNLQTSEPPNFIVIPTIAFRVADLRLAKRSSKTKTQISHPTRDRQTTWPAVPSLVSSQTPVGTFLQRTVESGEVCTQVCNQAAIDPHWEGRSGYRCKEILETKQNTGQGSQRSPLGCSADSAQSSKNLAPAHGVW